MISKKTPTPVHLNCGREILSLLRSQNHSQKWLAEQCGVTVGMINHIITGYALPSLPVAIKIAKSLEVTVDDIFCNS
jgi:DNA-binding XRE family transcriptional regulator